MFKLYNGLAGVLLCIAATVAWAQSGEQNASNRNLQAHDLAKKLGREANAEGLETIINVHNIELLRSYRDGFEEFYRQSGSKLRPDETIPLPADIEAVIVKYYRDAEVGDALKKFFHIWRVSYRSRALFDLMYENVRWDADVMITATDLPGIEAPLLELLKRQQWEEVRGAAIIRFMGKRNYRPAEPYLLSLLTDGRPHANIAEIVAVLEQFDSPDLGRALMQHMTWLRTHPQDPPGNENMDFLLGRLMRLPADNKLDYATFRSLFPATLDDGQKSVLISVIVNNKLKQGVPDLLRLLNDPSIYANSRRLMELVGALISFDSVEIWKQTRAEIERLKQQGKIDDGPYRYNASLLDAKIANPEKHYAEQKQIDRRKEFDAWNAKLAAKRAELLQLLNGGKPEKAAGDYENYLHERERLILAYADAANMESERRSLGNEYFNFASLVRFRVKQPVKAIELYGRAQKAGNLMAMIAIGDTYQFDLHDKDNALATFQGLLDQIKAASPPRDGRAFVYGPWVANWIEIQIAYLKTGKRYSGMLDPDELRYSGFQNELYFDNAMTILDGLPEQNAIMGGMLGSASGKQIDRNAVVRQLDKLPPSVLVLMRTMNALMVSPDADFILRYLDKHDPAGYLSAGLLMAIDAMYQQARVASAEAGMRNGQGAPDFSAIVSAAQRFAKQRNISLKRPPEPRYYGH